jgi:glycosyltransferase involved in cell wall biosynthesis
MGGEKLKVLFRGWTLVPHSYAIVNCFQLIHLHKYYGDKLEIYVEERPYYRPEWNNAKKLVYNQEYNDIIKGLNVWKGQDVDVVYSITYPYDVTEVVINNVPVPKCVFYTAEFSSLTKDYFCKYVDDNQVQFQSSSDIELHLQKNESFAKMYFTSPSKWCAPGIQSIYNNTDPGKNVVITHGVDTTIFKLHTDKAIRERTRKFYNISESDILLVNIGAMTQNKGIVLVLQALNEVVNRQNHKEFKLLLKGTGDLYNSQSFLESYLEQLQSKSLLTKTEMENLLENHIIFSDKTLSYDKINDIFNASDLYVSPYLAEGFNLTVLEALSAGLPVLVPKTGSTKEYIDDLRNNKGSDFIVQVDSLIANINGQKQNFIEVNNLISTLINNKEHIIEMKNEKYNIHTDLGIYIEANYSWKHVAGLLYEYLSKIAGK